jgi:hypothetical protein
MLQKIFFFLITSLLLSSCSQFGPDFMKAGRNEYNKVLAQTDDEEILLNLVRLRYADNPAFLKVNSVSTSFNWKEGFGLDGSIFESDAVGKNNIGIRGNTEYIEKPTISYSPLSGADFVKNVLTPIDHQVILLLARSGWSLERILRLTVNKINHINNASEASGPTPTNSPDYITFNKIAKNFRQLQKTSKITLGYQLDGNPGDLALLIKKDHINDTEVEMFLSELNINVKNNIIPITPNYFDVSSNDNIQIESRSLAGILFFLSHGVTIPADDIQEGRVTVTKNQNGEVFDWQDVLNDLFTVHTSKKPPEQATIAVEYRGNWFYIKDNDMQSKYTLMLLNQIAALQSGQIEKSGPILTLPVSSN